MKKILISLALIALLAGCASGPHPVLTSHVEPVATTNAAGVITVRDQVIYEVSTNAHAFVTAAQQIGATVATVAPPAAPVVTLLNSLLALGLAGVGLYARAKTQLAAAKAAESEATYASADRALAAQIGSLETRVRTETDPVKIADLTSQLAALEKERGKLAR